MDFDMLLGMEPLRPKPERCRVCIFGIENMHSGILPVMVFVVMTPLNPMTLFILSVYINDMQSVPEAMPSKISDVSKLALHTDTGIDAEGPKQFDAEAKTFNELRIKLKFGSWPVMPVFDTSITFSWVNVVFSPNILGKFPVSWKLPARMTTFRNLLFVKRGIGPSNLLLPRFKTFKVEIKLKLGKVPTSLLFATSKPCNLVRSPREEGNVPDIELPESLSSVKPGGWKTSLGRVPDMPQNEKSTTDKSVSSPTLLGIVPCKELLVSNKV